MSIEVQGSTPQTSVIGPVAAPGTGRGFLVQLGKLTGLNLNAVAQTTIFTTPAAGFARCIVMHVVMSNFTGAPTTNAMSLGASATPADWFAAAVLPGTAGATKQVRFYPAADTALALYGTGVAFVANVTVGGAAIAADLTVLGYFE